MYYDPNKVFIQENVQIISFVLLIPRWKKILWESLPSYQSKILKLGVPTVVKSNKIQFEQHVDLVDDAYSSYNANILDSQDLFGQCKNDKTG